MATVYFMKFNRDQGALIADEMTWHLSFKYGYRPTRYGDSILDLLDSKTAAKNGFSAVYAGVGFPSLHFEIARQARKKIETEPACMSDLDATSKMVEDIYQSVHGRMINDRLKFLLGFDRDQLNGGKFKFDGADYEIKQEAVKSEAKKILKYQDKKDCYRRIFDNEGLVMGYDRENGIRSYHISNDGKGINFAYPFDAIGPGKEIGTKVFAEINSRMQLDQRREGFGFMEGLFILISAFYESYDFNSKAGGYTQIYLIDGKKEFVREMTREINDHNCQLTGEIARAYRWGYLDKDTAVNMYHRLLIDREDWEPVEAEMFEKSKDPAKLRKHLMGFRPFDAPVQPLT